MGFGDPFGDGEAEAGAAHQARTGFVGAVEAVEDAGECLWRDSAAAVGDAQDGLAAFAVEGYADGGGVIAVLYGVVEQDREQLAQARLVAADLDAVRCRDVERDALGLGEEPHLADGVFGDGA